MPVWLASARPTHATHLAGAQVLLTQVIVHQEATALLGVDVIERRAIHAWLCRGLVVCELFCGCGPRINSGSNGSSGSGTH